jgi:hypothetical protein
MSTMLPPQVTDKHSKSRHKAAHAIALLSEGLIEPFELMALCGIEENMIPALLQSELMLDEVRRATTELRVSGESARLEAAHHAREAVQVAATIMRDPEMLASNRLNAATFIAKVSGTERPPVDAGRTTEKHTITINIGGDRPPIVVESNSTQSHVQPTRDST